VTRNVKGLALGHLNLMYRGVTIDVASQSFSTPKRSFHVLDAPGHRDFIPNMIAGATQADFALLVLDASLGGFESGFAPLGQTREHALLVRSLGVQKLVIAVNKLDTVKWSEHRFNEISTQIRQFLSQVGYSTANIWFIPCSGLDGVNLVSKPDEPLLSWYSGPTLLGCIGLYPSKPTLIHRIN
jgi:elongation factor 1 alpha-like protein